MQSTQVHYCPDCHCYPCVCERSAAQTNDLTDRLRTLGRHLLQLDSGSKEGQLMFEAAGAIEQYRRMLEIEEAAADSMTVNFATYEAEEAEICERCNGSGEVALSVQNLRYRAPGPVPDDAKGVAPAKCRECEGTGRLQ